MLDYSKEKESMGEQVDPFDLTKKQEADLQRIRQFRLIDDVFMNKVFEKENGGNCHESRSKSKIHY